MRPLRFHELAERELNDAARYYEIEHTGLGFAFLDEVERSLSRISRHPESGRLLTGRVRRYLLRRFPYALLYSARPDEIRILAIMNLKRRPGYWIGRR